MQHFSHLTTDLYTFKDYKQISGLDTFIVLRDLTLQPKVDDARSAIKKQTSDVAESDSGNEKSLSSSSDVDTGKSSGDQRRRSKIPIAKTLLPEPKSLASIKRRPKLNVAEKLPSLHAFSPHRCGATFPISLRAVYSNSVSIDYFRNPLPATKQRISSDRVPVMRRSTSLPPIQQMPSKIQSDPYATCIDEILSLVDSCSMTRLHNK